MIIKNKFLMARTTLKRFIKTFLPVNLLSVLKTSVVLIIFLLLLVLIMENIRVKSSLRAIVR